MTRHADVTVEMVDAALTAAPMLRRFYVLGGGSDKDLITDLSHALAVMIPVQGRVIDLRDRRSEQRPFVGPDRRRFRQEAS